MDFDRIAMMFSMQEPFYGILLSSMRRIPTDKLDTMGISKSGNVFQFKYNPKFLEPLNNDTILQLLRHECLHVAFNHFSIWEHEAESPEENRLRNIAEDLEINGYLDRNKIQKEAGGLFPEDFGLDKFLGTREYYRIFKQMMQDNRHQQAHGNPNKPCNGGQGGQSQTQHQELNDKPDSTGENKDNSDVDQDFFDKFNRFDDHSEWPEEKPDSSEAMQLQQMIDDMLDFAAEECEKNHGTIPSEMAMKIEQIRKKPRPVADWKRYFRRYLGNEFSELIRKSKKRESKRFPDAAGTRHKRKSHILVGIDTSGSISMPEYKEFFGQIHTLSKSATFHIVECDARIQHEYEYNGKTHNTVHGGGGTSFQPVIDKFNNNRRLYDALVYFTDGCAPIPHDTPKDTLWVISSDGDHDRKKYKKNGASVVFIPNKR